MGAIEAGSLFGALPARGRALRPLKQAHLPTCSVKRSCIDEGGAGRSEAKRERSGFVDM